MAAESRPPPGEFAGSADLPSRTVFFDGVCNFCDRSVQWLLAHDASGALHFAALQGSTAEELRARLDGFPNDQDGIVYLDSSGPSPVILRESSAIFALLDLLDPPARRWRFLRFLPRPLTDLGYRLFARLRYRLFGRRDSCVVPSPEERARFLP